MLLLGDNMGIYEKFAEYYDMIYGRKEYQKESDVIERIIAKSCTRRPTNILDIGCGTGSHAIALSKRGFNVTGIDFSPRMIEKAKKNAAAQKSKARFVVQDMRKIKLHKRFDCAICMFGGFGYILTYDGLASLFKGLRQHLVEKGLFIYEFWNIGGIKPSPYQTWLRTREKKVTLYRLSESSFQPSTNTLRIDMHFIVLHDAKLVESFDETHTLRCYTLPEMNHYLVNNGFKLISAHDSDSSNSFRLAALKSETFRVLTVAQKT